MKSVGDFVLNGTRKGPTLSCSSLVPFLTLSTCLLSPNPVLSHTSCSATSPSRHHPKIIYLLLKKIISIKRISHGQTIIFNFKQGGFALKHTCIFDIHLLK